MSVAEKEMGKLVAACDRTRDEFPPHLEAAEAQGVWLDRGYQLAQSVHPGLKWLTPIGSTLLFRKRKDAASGLGWLASVLKTRPSNCPPCGAGGVLEASWWLCLQI